MNLIDFPTHFQVTFPGLVGSRILVALSGGPDSVALLDLLRHPDLALHLEVAHVHHGVRGTEADADADFCSRLCQSLGVEFHLLRLGPVKTTPEGREAAWRRLRYAALLDLKHSGELDAVATAHHRDDVAEGVVVQLLRGGGPRALSGIATETADGVIRPLLPWSRSEILDWLRKRTIEFRQDSSNRDIEHLRNLVRRDILPALVEASPSVRGHLVHLADSLAEAEAYFAAELQTKAHWIDPWEPSGGVPVSVIRDLAPPLRARWLHAQASRVGIGRVTRRQLDLLHSLVESGSPRAITLAGRWRLRLAGHHLWLEPPRPLPPYQLALAPGAATELPLPGWWIRAATTPCRDDGVRWRWRPPTGTDLCVRTVRPGEHVTASGRETSVRALLARSLPRHLRAAWPVFCEDDKIYWIPGVWQASDISSREDLVVEVIRR
ncbi:MAG: tRNA lysidine(34) synthetase TilS [Acidobacteriota bacterium]